MSIELATSATPQLEAAFARLIPQLSSTAAPMDIEQIDQLLAQPCIDLLLFKDEGEILGMLTLVTFTIPTGTRAWIEDVVVDDAARGKGAGRALVEAACDLATTRGAKSVDLTSRPSREAANRLYRRCGFEARKTNVYRYGGK
ncbi:N-acetyltransferase [Trueperella bernardiae]|uniref:GNAT family N-acetyltransferase n=1 Tax=Trueperella bernardiae TaxID=59561 RepID=A0A0W1KIK7_9ACTO|nr:GNAT family N-acetyltransferase [Trueperella bernardiae]KTF03734.1 Mycothiol acetyltransferase [Trueperella bernardiae]MDK8601626.1 GNAT family N-acetyltransferase [Trueperella bernardiae]MDV6239353.1 GNAT family N-acetyltransferase [Trueperella bernardiae]OCW61246.1 GNAT family acetyltransferase [Trueperella bernardiae]PKZ89617.1 N-acetyltransferase [Trueperella bernardiae]